MIKDVEMLDRMRCIVKLYDRLSAKVCEKWKINRTEMDVLAFLNNHPDFDTARDIVEIRMLPKANVSLAVESLIQKGYLARRIDERTGDGSIFPSPKEPAGSWGISRRCKTTSGTCACAVFRNGSKSSTAG